MENNQTKVIEKIELEINIQTKFIMEKINKERLSIELIKKGITKGFLLLSEKQMSKMIPFTKQFDKHLVRIIKAKERPMIIQDNKYKQPNKDLLSKIFDIIDEMEAHT